MPEYDFKTFFLAALPQETRDVIRKLVCECRAKDEVIKVLKEQIAKLENPIDKKDNK
jgi:SMC interacting uncharacterized protein involved in chromosome segregation